MRLVDMYNDSEFMFLVFSEVDANCVYKVYVSSDKLDYEDMMYVYDKHISVRIPMLDSKLTTKLKIFENDELVYWNKMMIPQGKSIQKTVSTNWDDMIIDMSMITGAVSKLYM